MAVTVRLEWSQVPELSVEPRGSDLLVRVHPSLSEQQVRLACSDLNEHGETVFHAWKCAVGLSP